jgi:hypothetical protein
MAASLRPEEEAKQKYCGIFAQSKNRGDRVTAVASYQL